MGEMCAQLKDPARNGGRDLTLLHEHFAKDELVGWGSNPGAGRAPAPGTQEQLGELIKAWIIRSPVSLRQRFRNARASGLFQGTWNRSRATAAISNKRKGACRRGDFQLTIRTSRRRRSSDDCRRFPLFQPFWQLALPCRPALF